MAWVTSFTIDLTQHWLRWLLMSGSMKTLAQLMLILLSIRSLGRQVKLSIRSLERNLSELNENKNTRNFIHENIFENAYKCQPFCFGTQCVNWWHKSGLQDVVNITSTLFDGILACLYLITSWDQWSALVLSTTGCFGLPQLLVNHEYMAMFWTSRCHLTSKGNLAMEITWL